MFNKEREQEILSLLKARAGFISVKELCEVLFASESSIRRDLKVLEQRGLIKRSYGGASLVVNSSSVATFLNRTRLNTNAKREIAQKADALISDGDVVFLDQSSSSFFVANQIINRNSLTVVTNNIEIMMLLSNSGIKLISSGGYLSSENRNCLIGGDAQRTFENIYANVMFFSVKGVTEAGTVGDYSREEVIIREAMLRNSEKKVLLCDSSKLGVKAPYKQCDISQVDYLICEQNHAEFFSSYRDRVKLL